MFKHAELYIVTVLGARGNLGIALEEFLNFYKH